MVIDKTRRPTTIIDVAVLLEWKDKDREDEKIWKYQDLRIEIHKLWNTKAKVITTIVGSLGAISMNIERHLMEIPGKRNSTALCKSAPLGSANILRRMLNLYGIW